MGNERNVTKYRLRKMLTAWAALSMTIVTGDILSYILPSSRPEQSIMSQIVGPLTNNVLLISALLITVAPAYVRTFMPDKSVDKELLRYLRVYILVSVFLMADLISFYVGYIRYSSLIVFDASLIILFTELFGFVVPWLYSTK